MQNDTACSTVVFCNYFSVVLIILTTFDFAATKLDLLIVFDLYFSAMAISESRLAYADLPMLSSYMAQFE